MLQNSLTPGILASSVLSFSLVLCKLSRTEASFASKLMIRFSQQSTSLSKYSRGSRVEDPDANALGMDDDVAEAMSLKTEEG